MCRRTFGRRRMGRPGFGIGISERCVRRWPLFWGLCGCKEEPYDPARFGETTAPQLVLEMYLIRYFYPLRLSAACNPYGLLQSSSATDPQIPLDVYTLYIFMA